MYLQRRQLGLGEPVAIATALSVGKSLADLLGLGSRGRTASQNLKIRKDMVDRTLSMAMQRTQPAVLQLWLWSGVPVTGSNTYLPTNEARRYAAQAVVRYYETSGARPLDVQWMEAIQQAATGGVPRVNGVPPVPETFEGRGFNLPGTDITIPGTGMMSMGPQVTPALLLVGAALVGIFMAGQNNPRRRRR